MEYFHRLRNHLFKRVKFDSVRFRYDKYRALFNACDNAIDSLLLHFFKFFLECIDPYREMVQLFIGFLLNFSHFFINHFLE